MLTFSVFSVSSTHSWNPEYDYNYRGNFYNWPPFPYQNFPFGMPHPFNGPFPMPHTPPPPRPPPPPSPSPTFPTAAPISPQCNCIKMRDCAPLMTKLVTAAQPLSTTFVKDLRKTSCGYAGIEPLVCCPYDTNSHGIRRSATTEKPWIWDVLDKRTNKHSKYYGPKDSKKKHYFFEFEDPRTYRNCPPSFSPDFDMPHRFHNTSPVRNYHPLRINVDGMSPSDISDIKGANEDIEPNLIFSNSNEIGTAIVFPTVSSIPAHKAHLINPGHCGISINSRIIGAEDAGPGQFPWYYTRYSWRQWPQIIMFIVLYLFSIEQDGSTGLSQ